jgi:pentatricopeptide repeat protein
MLILQPAHVGAPDIALAVHEVWTEATGWQHSSLQLTNQVLACCCGGYFPKEALRIWGRVRSTGLPFDELTASLVITACSHAGLVDDAFGVLKEMLGAGLSPSTVTVAAIIQGCNFKRHGLYQPALQASSRARSSPFPGCTCTWSTPPGAQWPHVLLAPCLLYTDACSTTPPLLCP